MSDKWIHFLISEFKLEWRYLWILFLLHEITMNKKISLAFGTMLESL